MDPGDSPRMQDARRYIRHPVDIPIEVRGGVGEDGSRGTTHDVSLGGLSFEVPNCVDPGEIVDILLPSVRPPFQTRGRVSWCRQVDGSFEMGVQFLEVSDAFRARMVEQVCHIEQYRMDVREQEGRDLSGQDAAREWIQKFAAGFPNPDRNGG